MTSKTAAAPYLLIRHLGRWARRRGLGGKFAIALAVASILSGFFTYAIITDLGPFGKEDPETLFHLLTIDLILMLLVGVIVAKRLVQVWTERQRGSAGSKLHIRLVILFGVVAVTPASIVAVFSVLFFTTGIQSWFNEKVSTAISESLEVAQSYLEEHQQNIRADALAMANDLNRAAAFIGDNPQRLGQLLAQQTAIRSLTEAIVFDGSGQIVVRTGLTFATELKQLPQESLEKARAGEVVVLTRESDDRVSALVHLERLLDSFLLVGRFVEPKVVRSVERTREAVGQYEALERERTELQIMFNLIFFVVALLFLLAAVWGGLILANRLVRPIGDLIAAAERVRAGDLSARVPRIVGTDELGMLGRAFNRMTNQLRAQREELVETNRQLDDRRRFTEAVLEGVSAGVIGLDRDGQINLPNRSASTLLGLDLDHMIGRELAKAVPEMAGLVEKARDQAGGSGERQIKVIRKGRTHTLLVRIAVERINRKVRGYVVTFDDITALLQAQRTAAWADVARRIAHEIKNPLTPIQLSAERLKRKYLKEIDTDTSIFTACTDTIVRQVADIRRMVDEFSAFTRMPAPDMKRADLGEICQQAVLLQRNAHPKVTFNMDLPEEGMMLPFDNRQISQALTNLLQNSVQAIEGREAKPGEKLPRGRIDLRVQRRDGRLEIAVEDNGRGLPDEGRERLTEPYMTTRPKGTGLGLAIVKKIMEDHNGELVLEDGEAGGARVKLVFFNPDKPADGDRPAPARRRRQRRSAESRVRPS
ncbi:MAG: ATP-binding protein [Kiloniellales bacterium]